MNNNSSNMTDILEEYIKKLFNEAPEDYIIIKRSNVAPEHGFIIESKRGGGGFIRITKITLHTNKDYIDYLIDTMDDEIIELDEAVRIAKILLDKEYIEKFDYNHFLNSLETIIAVHNECLNYIDKEVAEKLQHKTKTNLKDLTVKFLTNIKYNKRG